MVGDYVSLMLLGMNEYIPLIGAALHHDPPVSRTKRDPRPPVFLSDS